MKAELIKVDDEFSLQQEKKMHADVNDDFSLKSRGENGCQAISNNGVSCFVEVLVHS